MNQIIEYFKNATCEEFILGLIIACFVIRYCYEILRNK